MGINEIFDCIYSFEEETKADLHEKVSGLTGDIYINKNENGLSFKLGYPYYKTLYNEKSDFVISHKSLNIRINHFLANYDNQNISSRICNAYIFQSLNFNENEKTYFCYYSRIETFFLLNFFDEFKNPVSLKIGDFIFNISTCNINQKIKHNFLCIECESKIEFKKFKHYVNNLIASIGFLTGNFYKFEEFYIQSNQCDFKKDTDFFYRNSKKKYSFPYPFTQYPNEWSWRFKNNEELPNDIEKEYSTHIDEKIFINLVELLIENPKIYFSIRMIFDFYNYPQISRIPLMFVVLETICEEFKKTSTSFIEKIRIKQHALEILKRNKNSIKDDDYKTLEESINKIDKKLIGNLINYEKTFKSLIIDLNDEDKKVLQKRNDFFHGIIIPELHDIENEEDYIRIEKNYDYYSLRLYVLISKLIMKKINFRGYLINYPKLFEDNNEMNLSEPYFIELK